MTYYEQINKLADDFFGGLTFEQLENIFGEQLFGLSIEETERTLKSIREDWGECEWNAVLEIMQEFDREINN
jgi:hypothetical protein